jgi:hypothetical protein
VQVVTQVGQKILCKFTVLRQNSCQPQKKIKQNQGLTDYSSLSSVDCLKDGKDGARAAAISLASNVS